MEAQRVQPKRAFARNTQREHVAERNIPMVAAIIEGAYGPPNGHTGARRVAERLVGPDGDADYLLSRIPKHLGLLGEHACHKQGRPACKRCPVRLLCTSHRVKADQQESGPRVLDLFCGAGGMSLGFDRAGFRTALAVDLDQDAVDSYRANRPGLDPKKVVCGDVAQMVQDGSLRKYRGKVDGIVGGPPCQTFSIVGYRTKTLDDRSATIDEDARTWLPIAMARAIAQVEPRFCVMENVAHFRSALGGKIRDEALAIIRDAGYSMGEIRLRANLHGVPQYRYRYVLVGIRQDAVGGQDRADGIVQAIVEAMGKRSAADISFREAMEPLASLDPVSAGGGAEYVRYGGVETWNHKARPHNGRDLGIYGLLRPGETAHDLDERQPGVIPYRLDSFRDKYRKLDPDRPSPTIPSHLRKDANSFVHPFRNRGITPREAALLQGFPRDYLFVGPMTCQFVQVGNAVPPPAAEALARTILEALDSAQNPS